MDVAKLIGADVERQFNLEVVRSDNGAGTLYRATLSSEQRVAQFFGDEVLDHSAAAVNLERAADGGLALLFNHDIDRPIGRATEIRLDEKARKLRGVLEFDADDADAERLRVKVDKGHLRDISIRYQINDAVSLDDGAIKVTRWTPTEVSLVTVPADHTVGIGRARDSRGQVSTGNEGNNMDPTKTDDNVVDFTAALETGRAEGRKQGANVERERIANIEALFGACRHKGADYDALRRDCITRGSTLEQTQRALLELMNREPGDDGMPTGARGGDTGKQTRDPHVAAGDDQLDKLDEGVRLALEARVDLLDAGERREVQRTNEFFGVEMLGIAREYCRRNGIDCRGASREDVIGYAFRPDRAPGARRDLVGHATGDLTNILANTANKSLLRGYEEAPETWAQWTRQTDLPDFKVADRTGMSEAETLLEVPEGGEYKHGTQSDRKETIQGKKFGRLIAFTREAMINDDLNAIGQTPRRLGRAASRAVGDKVYALLTSPPTLNQDGLGLFHANHNNTGTAGAPSVTTLDEMRKLMALQTDQGSNAHGLNIRPRYILVPVALETTSTILVTAEKDPAGGAGKSEVPNPFRGAFQVVADPRLDADSAVKWYGSADPNAYDTIEVGFVGGRREPALMSRDGWTIDGIEWKVRHEFGVAVLEFRTMFYNAGA